MKPAAWSRRQKSFRGFAKWAAFASEWNPGLMPQKTTSKTRREHVGDRAFCDASMYPDRAS